jgi:hypothetical protein
MSEEYFFINESSPNILLNRVFVAWCMAKKDPSMALQNVRHITIRIENSFIWVMCINTESDKACSNNRQRNNPTTIGPDKIIVSFKL